MAYQPQDQPYTYAGPSTYYNAAAYSPHPTVRFPDHDLQSRYARYTPPPTDQHVQSNIGHFQPYATREYQSNYRYTAHSSTPAIPSSQGRDYLLGLSNAVADLSISPEISRHKPLPQIPQHPSSATSLASMPVPYRAYLPISPLPRPPVVYPTPPDLDDSSTLARQRKTYHSGREFFTPSFHPDTPPHRAANLLQPPIVARPHSDDALYTHSKKTKAIDLSADTDSDHSDSDGIGSMVTKRSPARRRRAQSERPTATVATPKARSSKSSTPSSPSTAVRCAGFTLAGAPCKRLVKAQAQYLASRDLNVDAEGELNGRYCKDHAGKICDPKGFYSRHPSRPDMWITFDALLTSDYIPNGLGEQTRTLLRMTMESKLTEKDLPGFLYIYELRDLQSPTVSYFKVGRTDNVPRRISQWTSQCQSHTPTLRDILPRRISHSSTLNKSSDLARRSTGSFLPGALHSASSDDTTRPRIQAMKRWERLVHLELSEISATGCPVEWAGMREKCADCRTIHKEIFPIAKVSGRSVSQHEDAYEVVVEVVNRWADFVSRICQCDG